jgi:hypothetical protein
MEERAKKNQTKALMMKIQMALEDYKEELGNYPTQTTLANLTIGHLKDGTTDYLKAHKYPKEFKSGLANSDTLNDAWEKPFKYIDSSTTTGFENTYELWSSGSDGYWDNNDPETKGSLSTWDQNDDDIDDDKDNFHIQDFGD